MHLVGRDAGGTAAVGDATQTLLVACGTDRRTSQDAIAVAALHPNRVKAFAGVHPSEADRDGELGWLMAALEGSAGLGEVGLDPSYSPVAPRSTQMGAFLSQLEAAQKLSKPVQIHSRGAEKMVLDILGSFGLKRVLMHWLESEELLPAALEKGYFVSFGPAVLYSKKLQRMARKAPPDQVLTETDSPVAYRPLNGAHGPSLVPSVVFRLAELWGVPFEDARRAVFSGSLRFLGLPEKG